MDYTNADFNFYAVLCCSGFAKPNFGAGGLQIRIAILPDWIADFRGLNGLHGL
jgi:hypothetical protein